MDHGNPDIVQRLKQAAESAECRLQCVVQEAQQEAGTLSLEQALLQGPTSHGLHSRLSRIAVQALRDTDYGGIIYPSMPDDTVGDFPDAAMADVASEELQLDGLPSHAVGAVCMQRIAQRIVESTSVMQAMVRINLGAKGAHEMLIHALPPQLRTRVDALTMRRESLSPDAVSALSDVADVVNDDLEHFLETARRWEAQVGQLRLGHPSVSVEVRAPRRSAAMAAQRANAPTRQPANPPLPAPPSHRWMTCLSRWCGWLRRQTAPGR